MSAVKNVIKDNYNMMLLKDYLREKIKDAGFEEVEVSKTPTGTRVVLHVTRPVSYTHLTLPTIYSV